jgi:hypothetical protein
MKYIIVLFLSGCANVTMMDQLHVNNNAPNNFVGNPCNFATSAASIARAQSRLRMGRR